MKSAFEIFLIFFLGMTFVLIGFSMVDVTFSYNRARLLQETIVSLVERHDRYDAEVDALIKQSRQHCSSCTYEVIQSDDRYLVEVLFDVNVAILNYNKKGSIKAYTQSLQ